MFLTLKEASRVSAGLIPSANEEQLEVLLGTKGSDVNQAAHSPLSRPAQRSFGVHWTVPILVS